MRWFCGVLVGVATMAAVASAGDPTEQQQLSDQLDELEQRLNAYEPGEVDPDAPSIPTRAELEQALADMTTERDAVRDELSACRAALATVPAPD